MTKDQFIRQRYEGRKLLFENIIEAFKALDPYAIHTFGSATAGFKDEFSDIDIWVTFNDTDIEKKLRGLSNVFKEIAPVLIKHHSKTWSPVDGSSNSVIHEVNGDLFVVDYYISKVSETVLKKNSKLIFGKDDLPKGEWKLNRHVDEKMKDSHTLKKDVELFIDLIFVSYKGIIRKWDDDNFINILKMVHKAFREKYQGKLPGRRISLSFNSNYRLLNDLYRISNKRQKKAINKIKKYAHQIEKLYDG